jgi:hypothetical protein
MWERHEREEGKPWKQDDTMGLLLRPSNEESLEGILGTVAPDDSRPRAAGVTRACLLGVMRKRSPGRTPDSVLVHRRRDDLAADLGIHSGSPPALLERH